MQKKETFSETLLEYLYYIVCGMLKLKNNDVDIQVT